MRENRLLYKIGGPPGAIKNLDKALQHVHKSGGETAAAAMASAVPQDERDTVRDMVAKKIGRPTIYREEMAVQVYEWLSDPRRCYTLKACSALLGVYEQTFYEWLKAHDDLKFAVFSGKAIQEANFGAMLLHGFKYSSGVEFILTNLHDWTQKQKTEHALDLNAAIAAQERERKAVRWVDGQGGADVSGRAIDQRNGQVVDVGDVVAQEEGEDADE